MFYLFLISFSLMCAVCTCLATGTTPALSTSSRSLSLFRWAAFAVSSLRFMSALDGRRDVDESADYELASVSLSAARAATGAPTATTTTIHAGSFTVVVVPAICWHGEKSHTYRLGISGGKPVPIACSRQSIALFHRSRRARSSHIYTDAIDVFARASVCSRGSEDSTGVDDNFFFCCCCRRLLGGSTHGGRIRTTSNITGGKGAPFILCILFKVSESFGCSNLFNII